MAWLLMATLLPPSPPAPQLGDVIEIKPRGEENNWLALIDKVEAAPGETRDVWLTVSWFYSPDDTHGGRQPHHGEFELLRSTHQDRIHVATVQGKISVKEWKEGQDDDGSLEGYY
ncbi:hypothetical protein BDK51DRAFT_30030 [Blyttiomyces helicus]|uniref:BAH domain-containing protein n=1 Tax=Blyttiomyces helicus TaxID=388810 RepID=A0A4P9VXW6_9FUNG|nr:hypothetical protein BDK51DRAFT_30030 [Blyttiomyces helicus]|eukprot:RKO84579.1 hypothetical protein BDK51DRAFT_30030 [Blyttiomyces helicus]